MFKLDEFLLENEFEIDDFYKEHLNSLLKDANNHEIIEILRDFLLEFGFDENSVKDAIDQLDKPEIICSKGISNEDILSDNSAIKDCKDPEDVQISDLMESVKIKDKKKQRKPKQKKDDYSRNQTASEMENVSKDQAIGTRMRQVRRIKQNAKYSNINVQDSLIQATTIQSRFHLDTIETLSNDVDLKLINISIGEKVLLKDADLKLFQGRKYCLVGRNGVGKSTLFKAIGHGYLAGFPTNIRVMLVEQFEAKDDKKVIDLVLEADETSMRAYNDFKILTSAQENPDPNEIVIAVRRITLQRLEDQLWHANQQAIKRSGARGATARKELLIAEVKVAEAKEKLNAAITKDEISSASKTALEMLQEIHHTLQLFDFDTAYSKCRKILVGLGFSDEWIDGPLSVLSGGWKIRVSLARALFIEPDLLLLDEPTNHLDLPAILWLQNYLVSLQNVTIMLVSHDQSFLEAVSDETIIMRNQKLSRFDGTYKEYQDNFDENLKNKEKVAAALEKKKAHIEKSIQNGLAQAKSKGDDKKLQMVASRKKKLNERFGYERNASGHRFKLNRDMVGYFLDRKNEVVIDYGDPDVKFSFPNPEELRHHGSLIELDNVSFGYTNEYILENITLNIQPGDKIVCVGKNGDGKSTLMNLISGKLSPKKGTINYHPQCRIGTFSQQTVNEIQSDEITLTYLQTKLQEKEQEIRAFFGKYGINGELMGQTLNSLSGGQKVRIAFGLATFNIPHLLLLDEPTNHLDMDTVLALEEAISSFSGGILCVTHDRTLASRYFSQCFMVSDKKLVFLENGVDQYIRILTKSKRTKVL